jgi:hypothetical protein
MAPITASPSKVPLCPSEIPSSPSKEEVCSIEIISPADQKASSPLSDKDILSQDDGFVLPNEVGEDETQASLQIQD